MDRKVGVAVVALAAALAPSLASAQATTGSVSGRIIDRASQQPVPDVQVFVAGTQRTAVTNAQGRFTLSGVPAGAREIRARRVGYAAATTSVTVSAGQTATADFVLATAATQLQEVTVNAVTGQQQRRVEAGTNIGNIGVDSLPKGPITQFSEVLQGRVAGVNLQAAAGQVGSSQRIRIRGANSLSLSNEPLVFIDGIQVSNGKGGFTLGGQDYSRLNDINFEEVENVEVLKGPAASAIYGSQAANGVLLITTRRGRAGQTRFRGYAEQALVKDVNEYPLNYATLQSFVPSGVTPGSAAAPFYVVDIPNQDIGYLNTRNNYGASAPYAICPNYQAAIPVGATVNGLTRCTQDITLSFDQFRDARTTPFQNGQFNKGGINASGGSEALTFFLGGDQEYQNGVLRPNNLTRTSLRTNVNARLTSNLNAGVQAAYVNTKTSRLSSDNSVFSPLINAFLGPAQYVTNMESDTVSRAGSRLSSYFGYNTADQRNVTAQQGVDRFILSSSGNYTPFSWLRINANTGLDLTSRFDQQTQNPNLLPLSQSYILGFRSASRASNYLWTATASGTGTFNLARNLISTTTAGSQFNRNLFRSVDCGGVGIPSGTGSCSATASQFSVSESYTDDRTIGGFVQQQLAYADRLFLTGSLRADNNSGLVSGLSYFPQANASWVLSKEAFFPKVDQITQVRLRAGFGTAGQRPGYGNATTFFVPVSSQASGVEVPALVLTNTGNQALKLERTTEREVGFDAGFFGDRLNTEYTYFNRRSKDALIARNLAPSAGLTGGVFQNLGAIRNYGHEINVNGRLLNLRNVALESRLIATRLNNRIDVLGQGIAPISFNRGAQAHREGFPAGGFFARPYTYNDADGDGKLARNEIKVDSSRFLIVPSTRSGAAAGSRDTIASAYLGNALPTSTQALSADLTLFRHFRIYTLFERRAGNKQLNYTEYFRCRTQGQTAPLFSQCSALSNPKASLASQAAYIAAQFNDFGASPYGYIEDAKFVKWRELSVRYDLPLSITRRARINNGLSLSVSGRNLNTWTKYSGLDPEINETGGGAGFTQGEFNTQPPVRTITFRIDIQP